ncbi:MAG TPA: MmgE/PrpD family protein [Candidatus Dormibacteraeota bacterium]|nr:MmgE/PrpD family protein [Candidatus Dormibacteraeota bacterium]
MDAGSLWGTCEWAGELPLPRVPDEVRSLALAQLTSAAAAVRGTVRHSIGRRLADPASGWAARGARAARMSIALDYDETAFAGHLGHSCALPVLVCAAEAGVSGERALVAMVAASEVAARLTASVTLGSSRGQTAAHTHAVGAVVGFGLVLGLSARQLETALSLVLAQPRRVLLPAFMGSDAKFEVAAAPILDAARAVQQAADGAKGLPSVLAAPGGVFDELASVPLPEAFSGYGTRWHLNTLSIKAVPGCAYLTSAVEAAASLGPLDLGEVDAVTAGVSIFTLGMEAESAPFLAGPGTPVPALGFTTGYNLAAALESGGLTVDDLHGERLAREGRWRVAGMVTLEHDEELTARALAATAPVGAAIAWAGDRARPYLTARGASDEMAEKVIEMARATSDENFTAPSKRIGARLTVRLKGGRTLTAERDAARGCCQEAVAARVALAEEKLAAQLGDTPDVGLGRLAAMTPAELRSLVAALQL